VATTGTAEFRARLGERPLRFWLTALLVFAVFGLIGALVPLADNTTPVDFGVVAVGGATALWREWLPEADPRRYMADEVGLGVTLGFGGAARFAAAGFPAWFVAAWAVLGGWLLLDGIQQLRHGSAPPWDGGSDESGPDRQVRRLADRIEACLADHSLTRREIDDRVAAGRERVDAALAHLEAEGRVERAGSAYRTVSTDSGALDGVRERLAAVGDRVGTRLARLVWPATVEFGADEDSGGSGRASSPDDAPVEYESVSDGNGGRRQSGRERERA
jgi:hypothetical protein